MIYSQIIMSLSNYCWCFWILNPMNCWLRATVFIETWNFESYHAKLSFNVFLFIRKRNYNTFYTQKLSINFVHHDHEHILSVWCAYGWCMSALLFLPVAVEHTSASDAIHPSSSSIMPFGAAGWSAGNRERSIQVRCPPLLLLVKPYVIYGSLSAFQAPFRI